jgi:hypothetical protein
MEICLDHAEKKLETAGNLLIPSSGMEIKYWRTIDNGISFNVDGSRGDSDVQVRRQTGVRQTAASHQLINGVPGKIEVFGPLVIPYL